MLVANFNAYAYSITGTAEGGQVNDGHVPRGQPAGISAVQLYYLVVTAVVIMAIAALWLAYCGLKQYQRFFKNSKFPYPSICIFENMLSGARSEKHGVPNALGGCKPHCLQ